MSVTRRLRPRLNAQLGVDVGDVSRRCRRTDKEQLTQFPVAVAGGEQAQDLELAGGQAVLISRMSRGGVFDGSGLEVYARCCRDNLILLDLGLRLRGGRLAHQPKESPLARQPREDPIPERLKGES